MTEVPMRPASGYPGVQPPRRGPSGGPGVAAVLLIGLLLGAIGGGAAGGFVASRQPGTDSSGVAAPLAPAQPVSVQPTTGDAVVDVVKELLPSVVTVINRLAGGQAQSSGSGFVIDAARGYVVTNNHVIENVRDNQPGASFDIVFSDNSTAKATLVGRDPQTDVAVLQVTGRKDLRAAMLANSDQVPVGATVVAIGSPLGEFQNTVTSGIVSAKGRRVQESDTTFLEDLLQTDAAINEGNSGGPLIWAGAKQVVGMNTLVNRGQDATAQGLGFAVSSNTIREITDELIKNGKVERGIIGIRYQPVSSRAAVSLGLPPQTTGIIITEILKGSPAEQSGLRPRDVITKVNEMQIDAEHPVQSILLRLRPGNKVKLTIIRDGKQQSVDVTLGKS
ncbi:MAG TPA: trypsin-like peptidase domain-containing protein [Candidatus Saccharimonadales bacterium]|nr:trypsin-like peptidase domain-containing protein [Candidatus Saccharimonadales bacterium]